MPAELAAKVVLSKENARFPFRSISTMVHRGPFMAERKLREWIRKNENIIYNRLKDHFEYPRITALIALSSVIHPHPAPIKAVLADYIAKRMLNAVKEEVKTEKDRAKTFGKMARFLLRMSEAAWGKEAEDILKHGVSNTAVSILATKEDYKENLVKKIKKLAKMYEIPVTKAKLGENENEVWAMEMIHEGLENLSQTENPNVKKELFKEILRDIERYAEHAGAYGKIRMQQIAHFAGAIAKIDERTAEKMLETLSKIEKDANLKYRAFIPLNNAPKIDEKSKKRLGRIINLAKRIKKEEEINVTPVVEEIDKMLREKIKKTGKELELKDILPLMKYTYTKMFEDEGAGIVFALLPAAPTYIDSLFKRWKEKPEEIIKEAYTVYSLYDFMEKTHPHDTIEHAVFQHNATLFADLIGLSDPDPEGLKITLHSEELKKTMDFIREYSGQSSGGRI